MPEAALDRLLGKTADPNGNTCCTIRVRTPPPVCSGMPRTSRRGSGPFGARVQGRRLGLPAKLRTKRGTTVPGHLLHNCK